MIVVIVGPTGVGKTKLSIELAKKLNAEIINGDAMQVYKELNIATAKITKEEMENIPHHLIDFVDKNSLYTVFDYQKDCRNKIKEIKDKGKNIIIVGGTGLYIKASLYNYQFNKETKTYDFSNKSNEELLNEIKKIEPSINIHINNRKRLERYLTKLYNNSISTNNGNEKVYDFKMIGLTTSRDNLYKRINERVDRMVQDGLIEEARNLYDNNVKSKAVDTCIGYKELWEYFDGKITLEDAIELIKKDSRHYAKRQYTFFNNQFSMNWFNVNYDNFDETIAEVYRFITKED